MEVDRPSGSLGVRQRLPEAGSWALAALRRLPGEVTDVSARPWRDATLARRVTLGLTAVPTLAFVISDTAFYGQFNLPWLVALVLALAKSSPIPLSALRPVLAWWLTVAMVVGFAVASLVRPGLFHNWAAGQAPAVTLLVVGVVAAMQCRPSVVVTQFLISEALVAAMPAPLSEQFSLGSFTTFLVIGVATVGVVRTRRQLGRQERLTDQERARRGQLEERTRIARELHDVVAHHMSVVAVQAEAAPYRVADPPPELAESFASIRENAVAALNEMRHILGMLRSEEPDAADRYAPQPGLEKIGELLDNVRAAGLVVARVGHGTPRPLPELVELSVFRIVQEALSNALRHAPGCRVEVELDYRADGVGVRVSNSLPADRPKRSPLSSGHGLNGMRERAAALGGTFTAGTREDGWFEVTASIPGGSA